MLRKKTGLIFIYKFILVEIVINMFVYNSLHYFPNTTYKLGVLERVRRIL